MQEKCLMTGADIQRVAVLGSGLIGTGWATCFVLHDRQVALYDIAPDRLERSAKEVESNLEFLRGKGLIDAATIHRACSLLTRTNSLKQAVEGTQLIQENVAENLAVKQAVLAAVEEVAAPAALFASSTSGLRITDIAAQARHPHRCLGAHPYNPPHLMPLVELTKGPHTDAAIIETAHDFYRALGKEPIVLGRDAVGFVGNRLQFALYREIVDLVMQGVCTVEDVDKACVFGPGLRWGILGPNLIFHLAGGPGGIEHLLRHIGPSFERCWSDMADWKIWPTDWPKIAQEGVQQEITSRPPNVGNTPPDIARFRDDALIELLRLHRKLPVPRGSEGGRT